MPKGEAAVKPVVVTIRVPFSVRERGGRKLVIVPQGAEAAPQTRTADSTLIKALARAHRWKRMMEEGAFHSIRELARAEQINESYVCRILRLTLLAPHIVEAVIAGQRLRAISLSEASRPFPVEWQAQAQDFAAD